MSNNALTESFNSGFGALSNAWNVPAVANGQVSLTGNSAMMEWAIGRDAGHGYGTYTVTAKAEGSQPGPGIILWPGDDKWPGQEIDMLEITPDGSGRQYGTVHWNNNGADAYATVIYDGVQGGSFHEYQMIWAPGLITFKVDGVTKGTIDGNVPVDYDHGGMNNTIGFMNNNPNTSLTISHLEFTPLGQSVVATPAPAQQAPAPSAPAPRHPPPPRPPSRPTPARSTGTRWPPRSPRTTRRPAAGSCRAPPPPPRPPRRRRRRRRRWKWR
ncbi:family 16 glycosylhydrolase [Paeniroseomonas aquatica]|uniref:family 16 glycosylhydrolase n=1 Tax=Paeniroseomonas aquatica TaxID=373043 RepID=UPI003616DEBD